jgi:hypothetical protein
MFGRFICDAMFYMASDTQPVICLKAMLLAERANLIQATGLCYVPESTSQGNDAVKLLHLLTPTSGLPDRPPNNAEPRRRSSFGFPAARALTNHRQSGEPKNRSDRNYEERA